MKTQKILLFGIVAMVLIGGSIALSYALLKQKPIEKRSILAGQHHILEAVRVDGVIQPAQSVDLSFERGGRIARLYKNVGDSVKAGDILAELENAAEGTVVSQARALLAQKRAGLSAADIDVYKAAADAARADLDKTKTDTQASVDTAQAAVDTAQNNLKFAAGGDQSQIVGQAYESALATVQAELPQMDGALDQADSVLGIDRTSVLINDRISGFDGSKLALATNQYAAAKMQLQATHDTVTALASATAHDSIDGAITNEKMTLFTLNQLLSSTADVIKATPTSNAADQANLAAMQATIELTRTALSAQSSQLVATTQAIENAKNSLNAYTIAYNKAQQDLVNAQVSAASLVQLKEAVYQQALANLASKAQPVRETDLAPLQAALDSADAAYSKTILRSPIDGIVSVQNGKIGTIISPNVPVLSVIDETSFQLEAFVSETDLAKIKIGNPANVTTDAYGASVVFPATVVKIDPNISTVNGVSGYKVTLQFLHSDSRIRAGLTGNATIVTQEKDAAVALPERSILQKNGTFEVLLATDDGQTKERSVEVGARGSDGWWEIVSGLQAGDRVEDFGN